MATSTCTGTDPPKVDDEIKWNVTCGVAEIPGKKTVTIMYTISDPAKHISWEWQHQTLDDGTKQHIAQMIAHDSSRGNRSKPVPDTIYSKLGPPKTSRESIYFKVKMTRKDGVSIEEFFNN